MPTFDLNGFFESRGESFSRKGEDGELYALDSEGNERPFDLASVAKAAGVPEADIPLVMDPKKTDIIWNMPENASDVSPVDYTDRLKLSVGNARGSLSYLKNKFEDARYVPDVGFTVRKDGVWHQVDPKYLGSGSAWDKTKELAKDLFADTGDMAINAAATTAAVASATGTAVGSGGVAIPVAVGLAGAGGAIAGSIRSSLGRLAHTYDATPEEQLQDIGIETLISMGGQGVAMGVKPGWELVKNGAGWAGKHLPEGAKAATAAVYGQITGVGYDAMQAVMAQPQKVMGRVTDIIKQSKLGGAATSVNNMLGQVKENGIQKLTTLLEDAVDALPKKYGAILDDLFSKADSKALVAAPQELSENAFVHLEEMGFGKLVPKPHKSGAKARTLMNSAGVELPAPKASIANGTAEWRAFTPEEAANRLVNGLPVEVLPKEALDHIMPIVNTMLETGKAGPLKGKAAAQFLTKMQTLLNSQEKSAFNSGNDSLKRLVSMTSDGWERGVSKAFKGAGLETEHQALSQLYAKYGNAVRMARSTLKKDNGETLFNKLLTGADRNLKPKGQVADLVSLLGEKGAKQWDDLVLDQAASKFLPWAPKLGLGGAGGFSLGVGANVLAAKLGLSGAALTAGVPLAGLNMMPRVVGRTIEKAAKAGNVAAKALPYAQKTLDFFKSNTPEQLKSLMQNEDAMKHIMRTMVTGYAEEDQTTKTLLQESGL